MARAVLAFARDARSVPVGATTVRGETIGRGEELFASLPARAVGPDARRRAEQHQRGARRAGAAQGPPQARGGAVPRGGDGPLPGHPRVPGHARAPGGAHPRGTERERARPPLRLRPERRGRLGVPHRGARSSRPGATGPRCCGGWSARDAGGRAAPGARLRRHRSGVRPGAHPPGGPPALEQLHRRRAGRHPGQGRRALPRPDRAPGCAHRAGEGAGLAHSLGSEDPPARGPPPRAGALDGERLDGDRLRGRAGPALRRAPGEAHPAARRGRDAPLLLLRRGGGGLPPPAPPARGDRGQGGLPRRVAERGPGHRLLPASERARTPG